MKNKPLIIAVLLIVIAVSSILFLNSQNIRTPVSVGSQAPDFEVFDIKTNNRLALGDLGGRVLFINFWASWCQPCRDEMPSIEALYQELRDNEKFSMVTILYNDSPEKALEYLASFHYTIPAFTDSKGTASKNFSVTGVPETYLVDKQGILRKRIIGPYDWASDSAKGFIYSLINE